VTYVNSPGPKEFQGYYFDGGEVDKTTKGLLDAGFPSAIGGTDSLNLLLAVKMLNGSSAGRGLQEGIMKIRGEGAAAKTETKVDLIRAMVSACRSLHGISAYAFQEMCHLGPLFLDRIPGLAEDTSARLEEIFTTLPYETPPNATATAAATPAREEGIAPQKAGDRTVMRRELFASGDGAEKVTDGFARAGLSSSMVHSLDLLRAVKILEGTPAGKELEEGIAKICGEGAAAKTEDKVGLIRAMVSACRALGGENGHLVSRMCSMGLSYYNFLQGWDGLQQRDLKRALEMMPAEVAVAEMKKKRAASPARDEMMAKMPEQIESPTAKAEASSVPPPSKDRAPFSNPVGR
jgi:hypothetical protein